MTEKNQLLDAVDHLALAAKRLSYDDRERDCISLVTMAHALIALVQEVRALRELIDKLSKE